MANDRIWLRCVHCGKLKLLAKYWPGYFDTSWCEGAPDAKEPRPSVQQFIEKHYECRPEWSFKGGGLHNHTGFELSTD